MNHMILMVNTGESNCDKSLFATRTVKLIAMLVLLGLVIGLGIVGVNKMRCTANCVTSLGKLCQIGLAIHSYHDGNHNRFPYVCDFGPGAPTGAGLQSLHFTVLPYIEGGSIYAGFSKGNPETYYRMTNGMCSRTVRTFVSPFETGPAKDAPVFSIDVESPGAVPPFPTKFTGWYSTTNFVANGMVFSPQPDNRPPCLKAITDGSSQTIMLAERFQICQSAIGDVPTLWGLGSYSAATASFALPTPSGDHPRSVQANLKLRQFVPSQSVANDADLPPGFQVAPATSSCDPTVLQTFYPSGLLVCLCDGSSRVISTNISPRTFWAAVTPAGNEALGADW
jgi:hypothetical protein